MANLNEIALIGRLTRDPETKQGGEWLIAKFGLAVNTQRGKDKEEEVLFVDVTCFGGVAKAVGEYMTKGRLVYVGGRLKLERWQKDGGNRSKHVVIARTVQFLGGKGDAAENSQGSGFQGQTKTEKQSRDYKPPHDLGEPPF